jgi:hypothetical protein
MQHVWEEREDTYKALLGRPEGKIPLEHVGVDGRIILKWIFKTWSGETWTGWIWLRIETDGRLLSIG